MAEEDIPKARIVSVNGKPFDVQPRPSVISVETEQYPWVHPLDQQEAREFLSKRLSKELYNDLINSPRPTLSASANETEKAEAEEVKRRRNTRLEVSGERVVNDVGSWLTRTLYEETFAVKPAVTLGGVLSHHYYQRRRINGREVTPEVAVKNLQDIKQNFSALSFPQFMSSCRDLLERGEISMQQLGDTIEDIGHLGIPLNNPTASFMLPRRLIQQIIENPTALAGSRIHLERGWLSLRAFASFQDSLLAPAKDERLLAEFNDMPAWWNGQHPTGIQMLSAAWYTLGKPGLAMAENFTFKRHNEKGYNEGLRKLAVLRASPDLAFLYTHFSAIGSINSHSQADIPQVST